MGLIQPPKPAYGKMSVHYIRATNTFPNQCASMNPYVIITCRTQEKKSSVASGEGSEPEWNETFLFTIGRDVEEITLRIMDKDTFSSDDFVGEATIPLHEVFREGEVPTKSYNVVKDEEYCGEIKLGLTFTAEPGSNRGCDEEDYGGGSRQSRNEYRGNDEEDYGRARQSRDNYRGRDEEDYGGSRQSRDEYSRRDEEGYSGSRQSHDGYKGRDEDQDYGGSRQSRDNYRGRDEDNYSGSRNDYRRRDEDNYGGYKGSRDDY